MSSITGPALPSLSTALLLAGGSASGILGLRGRVDWGPVALAVSLGLLAFALRLRSRRQPSAPALLRGLFVAAVLVWVGLACGLLPATVDGLATSGVLVFSLVAGVLALGALLPRPVPLPLRVLDFSLFAAAASLVGLDLGLRLYAERNPSPLLLPSLASTRAQLDAYRFRPGELRFGFPCNSAGYFDDEPPPADDPRRRWAVVGDSFVAGPVPHSEHFTTVAETSTGQVLQCYGVYGAGPREYVELLEREVLPQGPDGVLLCLFVSNDVTDSRRAQPSWFLRIFHPNNAPTFFFLRRRAAAAERRSILHREDSRSSGLFTPEEYLRLEGDLASQVCDPGNRAWPVFESVMGSLLAVVGDLPLRVLLLPDEFQVDDELWRAIVAERGPLDRELPQRRIREFLESRGVEVLDVLPALREAAKGGPVFLLRDTHGNARGNAVVGRELAAFLERESPRDRDR